MGINYNPRIVTNGLVLALDAGNIKSYPGSGTTWTDLIGRGNTGTLTNGPTYSSTSGGSIVFDGTNDNVSIGTNGFSFGSSPGTLSAWAKTRDRTSTGTIVSYGNAATNGARFLGVGQSNFYFSGYGSSISASGVYNDTWFNMVGVYDGTNASMYVNGALVAGPTARSSWNTVASNAGIGKNVNNSEYWSGDVAQVQIYNRALSAAEIQQNYNAFKGRYANYVANALSQYWIATLGGVNSDYGYGIAVDGSGNVYITGRTDSSGAGSYNVLIAKYNTSGIIQWQRTLSDIDSDYGEGIAVDVSGNVYVTGYTLSSGSETNDVLIVKYDTSGEIQWQRTLGGIEYDSGRGIAVDGSGNVYITGGTQSSGAGNHDVLITKYNTSGTIQWQRTLGGIGDDQGNGIAVDGSGNVYVTGYTFSSGAGSYDVLITKYNTSGTIQWQRTLGGANDDYGQGIAVDVSGNVYVTGYTLSSGSESYDVLIAKYNTSGAIQWQRTLGGANEDYGQGIAVDGSGNVYVTGETYSSGSESYDVLIAKYNTSGTIQWQRTLGGVNSDVGYGIAVDGSGNVYVTGSSGAGTNDVLIAKLPADGSLTGTYGALTYATSGLSAATSSLTSATSSLTSATSSLTSATSSLTAATSALTSSTISV